MGFETKQKFAPVSLNLIGKMVNKLGTDKLYENSTILNGKLKELVSVCNKKFGGDWSGKGDKGQEFVD